jgi:hypothetical protein
MKISEIKSDEVRNEAVRLAKCKEVGGECNTDKKALRQNLMNAFLWREVNDPLFWSHLNSGRTPNTPDLKLPICKK